MTDRPLTLRQQHVLAVVANDVLSAPEVAEHLRLAPSTAYSVLRALEDRGLVERRHTGLRPGQGMAWQTTSRGDAVASTLFPDDDDPEVPW